jgi:capsular polysaccharide biosynthesis protein
MDLQQMFRVLWRFRVIVAVGLLLGLMLAFLAMVRINLSSAPHFSYRAQPRYESTTTVLVKHPGERGINGLNPDDLDTLRNATTLYLPYAMGNAVMAQLTKNGPIHGKLFAVQGTASDGSTLPIIDLAADSDTAAGALNLARRHLAAFQNFLRNLQLGNGTPANQIVILSPVSGPLPGKLVQGRKLTKPILIFTAILVLTCGLAFVLENMRPRIRPVEDEAEDRHTEQRAKRLSA